MGVGLVLQRPQSIVAGVQGSGVVLGGRGGEGLVHQNLSKLPIDIYLGKFMTKNPENEVKVKGAVDANRIIVSIYLILVAGSNVKRIIKSECFSDVFEASVNFKFLLVHDEHASVLEGLYDGNLDNLSDQELLLMM